MKVWRTVRPLLLTPQEGIISGDQLPLKVSAVTRLTCAVKAARYIAAHPVEYAGEVKGDGSIFGHGRYVHSVVFRHSCVGVYIYSPRYLLQ